jgi:hypothetical protein
MSKRTDRIFAGICASIKLTAKEKRLYKYWLEWAANKKDTKVPTIGEICKALHTTPGTFLKTHSSLKEKGLAP